MGSDKSSLVFPLDDDEEEKLELVSLQDEDEGDESLISGVWKEEDDEQDRFHESGCQTPEFIVPAPPTNPCAVYGELVDLQPCSGIIFRGEASPGSATGASVWRIRKILVEDSFITTQWANGTASFSNIWDDRFNYVYS